MSTIIKTVELQPGELFTLPPGAKVIYTSSASSLSSTCDDIPQDSALKCYQLGFSVNANRAPSPNLENQDTVIDSIVISGVTYTLNEPNEDNLANAVQAAIPGVLTNWSTNHNSVGDRYEKIYLFQAPDAIGSTVELKITGPGFASGLWVKATETTCP